MPSTAPEPQKPPEKQRRILFYPGYYVEEVLIGVAEYARARRWTVHSSFRFPHYKPSAEAMDAILRETDGIIVAAASEQVLEWLSTVKNIPVVHADLSPFSLPPELPTVEPDYGEAGRMSARHLIGSGISHLHIYSTHFGVLPMNESFLAELKAQGWKCDDATLLGVDASLPRPQRIHWLAKTLKRLPRPLGIATNDDQRAVEVVEASIEAGLKIPTEVAVVGCDNRAVEQSLSLVPISTIDMNHRAVGRSAAALLEELMDGKTPPAKKIVIAPAGVIVRQSSATYVCDSPAITAAMRHMREHFQETLRIVDLARVAGLSLRVFQLEFKKHIGHTAMDEIQNLRLEHVKRLLRETDLKLDAVAVESGFASGRYMSDAFSSAFGVRPSKWRDSARGM